MWLAAAVDLSLENLTHGACAVANRNLTQQEWTLESLDGDYVRRPEFDSGFGAPQDVAAAEFAVTSGVGRLAVAIVLVLLVVLVGGFALLRPVQEPEAPAEAETSTDEPSPTE